MDSYVRNCLFYWRDNERGGFVVTADNKWVAQLDGYAIVPIEHYNTLIEGTPLQKRSGSDLADLCTDPALGNEYREHESLARPVVTDS